MRRAECKNKTPRRQCARGVLLWSTSCDRPDGPAGPTLLLFRLLLLLRSALGRLLLGRFGRLGLLRLFAAEPFRCRAEPSADAGFLRGAFRLRLGFSLRARVELAADEFDVRDLGAVALAVA